jgi:hypothetical protein
MKRLLIIFALCYCCTIAVSGQDGGGIPFKTFCNFYAGPAYINFNRINSYVQRPDILGSGARIKNDAVMLGAGLNYIHNRYIFGLAGSGISGKDVVMENGQLDLGAYSWLLNVGYITNQHHNVFSYVYGGIGVGGQSMEIENTSKKEIFFDKFFPLAQSDTQRYTLHGLALEAGYSYKWFVGHKSTVNNSVGVCLGLDGGVQYVLASRWSPNVKCGPDRYAPYTIYLRLCIGFYAISSGRE